MKKKKLKKFNQLLKEAGFILPKADPPTEAPPFSAALHALSIASDYMAGVHCDPAKVRDAIRLAQEGAKGIGVTLNGETRWFDNMMVMTLKLKGGQDLTVAARDGCVDMVLGEVVDDGAGRAECAAVPDAAGLPADAGAGSAAGQLPGDGVSDNGCVSGNAAAGEPAA